MTVARTLSGNFPDTSEKTLSERAFNVLRHDILSGRLRPAVRLKLADLQKHYGIGISPIRESLMRLEGDGLVVSEGQKGFAVAPVSVNELEDLTQTRQKLESIMLADSIRHGTPDWEAAIIAAFHRLSRTRLPSDTNDEDATNAWEERHRDFHHALVSACGSAWLMRFHSQLVDHSERYRRVRMFHSIPLEQQARNIDLEHRLIMDAALSRDTERAAQLLRDHVQRTADIAVAHWTNAERASAAVPAPQPARTLFPDAESGENLAE